MTRRWTEQERQAHAAFMKRLHQQRSFRYFRLPHQTRAAVAAALWQDTRPNASHISRELGVSHFYVCTVARAEGVKLKPGRRPRKSASQHQGATNGQ
jgi:hypothetical protein